MNTFTIYVLVDGQSYQLTDTTLTVDGVNQTIAAAIAAQTTITFEVFYAPLAGRSLGGGQPTANGKLYLDARALGSVAVVFEPPDPAGHPGTFISRALSTVTGGVIRNRPGHPGTFTGGPK